MDAQLKKDLLELCLLQLLAAIGPLFMELGAAQIPAVGFGPKDIHLVLGGAAFGLIAILPSAKSLSNLLNAGEAAHLGKGQRRFDVE